LKLEEKTSKSLIRTNPKLSGNLKLTVDSHNRLWFNSFSANSELSKDEYKRVRINPGSDYHLDVASFFKFGDTPSEFVFDVFRENDDIGTVKQNYFLQFEDFYNYGVTYPEKGYNEDFSIFAPIWLKENIPSRFVIFKVRDPITNNPFANVESGSLIEGKTYKVVRGQISYDDNTITEGNTFVASANPNYSPEVINVKVVDTDENNQLENVISYEYFKNYIEDAEIIANFDLSENSSIGSYIRNFKTNENFPDSPLFFNFKEDELAFYGGIKLSDGKLSQVGEDFTDYLKSEKSVTEFDQFVTNGFERNGVICPNIINLEFLFNDPNAENYEINRYFGMYVDDFDLGEIEPDLNKIKELYSVKDFNPFNPSAKNQVIDSKTFTLPYNSEKSKGYLWNKQDFQNTNAIGYVKSKNRNLYKINNVESNEYELLREGVVLDEFFGVEPFTNSETGRLYTDSTRANVKVSVEGELKNGTQIIVKNSKREIGRVYADRLPNVESHVPGTSTDGFYFHPEGNKEQIAIALSNAISNNPNFGFTINSYAQDNVVYIYSDVGSIGNQYSIEIIDETGNLISSNNKLSGGEIRGENKLIVDGDVASQINPNGYVKCKSGWRPIVAFVDNLNDEIFDAQFNVESFNNIDKKIIVVGNENDEILIDNSNTFNWANPFNPLFGIFSFYPLVDFDNRYLSTQYSTNYLNEYKEFFNVRSGQIIPGDVYIVLDNGNTSSTIEYNGKTFNSRELDGYAPSGITFIDFFNATLAQELIDSSISTNVFSGSPNPNLTTLGRIARGLNKTFRKNAFVGTYDEDGLPVKEFTVKSGNPVILNAKYLLTNGTTKDVKYILDQLNEAGLTTSNPKIFDRLYLDASTKRYADFLNILSRKILRNFNLVKEFSANSPSEDTTNPPSITNPSITFSSANFEVEIPNSGKYVILVDDVEPNYKYDGAVAIKDDGTVYKFELSPTNKKERASYYIINYFEKGDILRFEKNIMFISFEKFYTTLLSDLINRNEFKSFYPFLTLDENEKYFIKYEWISKKLPLFEQDTQSSEFKLKTFNPSQFANVVNSNDLDFYVFDENTIEFEEDLKDFIGIKGLVPNESTNIENTVNAKYDSLISLNLSSEYEHYKELFNTELFPLGKLSPSIAKWRLKGGKDVRGNPYRLNANDAFGPQNFSPSFDLSDNDPTKFTHEWYYLEGTPETYGLSDKNVSYFNKDFSIHNYLNPYYDYFLDYFTVEDVESKDEKTFEFTLDNIEFEFPYTRFDYTYDNSSEEFDFSNLSVPLQDLIETQVKQNGKKFQPNTPNGRWVNDNPHHCLVYLNVSEVDVQDITDLIGGTFSYSYDEFGSTANLEIRNVYYDTKNNENKVVLDCISDIKIWYEPSIKILHDGVTGPRDDYEVPQKPISFELTEKEQNVNYPNILYTSSNNKDVSQDFVLNNANQYPTGLNPNHPVSVNLNSQLSHVETTVKFDSNGKKFYEVNLPNFVLETEDEFNSQTGFLDIVVGIKPFNVYEKSGGSTFYNLMPDFLELEFLENFNSSFYDIVDKGIVYEHVIENGVPVNKAFKCFEINIQNSQEKTYKILFGEISVYNPALISLTNPNSTQSIGFNLNYEEDTQKQTLKVPVLVQQGDYNFNQVPLPVLHPYVISNTPYATIPVYGEKNKVDVLDKNISYEVTQTDVNNGYLSVSLDYEYQRPPSSNDNNSNPENEPPLDYDLTSFEISETEVKTFNFQININQLNDNISRIDLGNQPFSWDFAPAYINYGSLYITNITDDDLNTINAGDKLSVKLRDSYIYYSESSTDNTPIKNNYGIFNGEPVGLGQSYYPKHYDTFDTKNYFGMRLKVPNLINPDYENPNENALVYKKEGYRLNSAYNWDATNFSNQPVSSQVNRFYPVVSISDYQNKSNSWNTSQTLKPITYKVYNKYGRFSDNKGRFLLLIIYGIDHKNSEYSNVNKVVKNNLKLNEREIPSSGQGLNFIINVANGAVLDNIFPPLLEDTSLGVKVEHKITKTGPKTFNIVRDFININSNLVLSSEVSNIINVENEMLEFFNPQIYTNEKFDTNYHNIGQSVSRNFYYNVSSVELRDLGTNTLPKVSYKKKEKFKLNERQQRFSLFEYNSNFGTSFTFFRGGRLEIKERADTSTPVNFNLDDIPIVADSNRFDNYKFSVLMRFNKNSGNEFNTPYSIRFIENKAFETIVMLIDVYLEDYKLLKGNYDEVIKDFNEYKFTPTYTALYSLNDLKWKKDHFNNNIFHYEYGIPFIYDSYLSQISYSSQGNELFSTYGPPPANQKAPFFTYGVWINDKLDLTQSDYEQIPTMLSETESFVGKQLKQVNIGKYENFPFYVGGTKEILDKSNKVNDYSSLIIFDSESTGRIGSRWYNIYNSYKSDFSLVNNNWGLLEQNDSLRYYERIYANPDNNFPKFDKSSNNFSPKFNGHLQNSGKTLYPNPSSSIISFYDPVLREGSLPYHLPINEINTFSIGFEPSVASSAVINVEDQFIYSSPWIVKNSLFGNFNVDETSYFYEYGGVSYFQDVIKDLSYSSIAEMVNNGNPLVGYESYDWDNNGNQIKTTNEFLIEFVKYDTFTKNEDVNVVKDTNKPGELQLKDTIGYNLESFDLSKPKNFNRFSGYYEPIFYNLLSFCSYDLPVSVDYMFTKFLNVYPNLYQTPVEFNNYTEAIFDENPLTTFNIETINETFDTTFQELKTSLNRFKNDNIEFSKNQLFLENVEINYNENIGKIPEEWYLRINYENQNILNLSNNQVFPSFYFLVGENSINNRSMPIWLSNWDSGYYRKTNLNKQDIPIVGSREFVEEKAYMGSKRMAIPKRLYFETFKSTEVNDINNISTKVFEGNDIFHQRNGLQLNFKINLKRRMLENFVEQSRSYFENYINPDWSNFSSNGSIDDYIRRYFDANVVNEYTLKNLILFTKTLKQNQQIELVQTNISDTQKFQNGFIPNKNVSINSISEDLVITGTYRLNDNSTNAVSFSVELEKE
jgi:hypothetical protein